MFTKFDHGNALTSNGGPKIFHHLMVILNFGGSKMYAWQHWTGKFTGIKMSGGTGWMGNIKIVLKNDLHH